MFIAGVSGITEPPFNDLWTIPGEETFLQKFRAEDEALFKRIEEKGSAAAWFFTCQIDDFCGAIRNGGPPAVTGEDGMETVKFIEAMYTGQTA